YGRGATWVVNLEKHESSRGPGAGDGMEQEALRFRCKVGTKGKATQENPANTPSLLQRKSDFQLDHRGSCLFAVCFSWAEFRNRLPRREKQWATKKTLALHHKAVTSTTPSRSRCSAAW